MEGPVEEVVFTARYREWMVVKKLLIEPVTKPEDVSLVLASVDSTLVRKSFEFTGINVGMIDAYVENLCKGKSKSWSNLAAALQSVKPSELKAELLKACPELPPSPDGKIASLYPVAETYFVKKLLETIGYSPVLTPETLQESFPSLKIPKPRGNFGKKKK